MIAFHPSLDKIVAYKKGSGSIEILLEMKVSEMESCVRSCTTTAFANALGFFTKSKKYFILRTKIEKLLFYSGAKKIIWSKDF